MSIFGNQKTQSLFFQSPETTLPKVPEDESTPPEVSEPNNVMNQTIEMFLNKIGLKQYCQAFHDLGYDDLEYLSIVPKPELLTLLTTKLKLLDGHAEKFIHHLLKQADSKKNHYISFIVDRSGSMASMKGETVNGFNKFVEEQKNAKKSSGEAWLTLTTFDNKVELVYDSKKIQDVPLVTSGGPFSPRGSTALLDAIGETIILTEQKAKGLNCEEVTVVILTDGHENASVKWSREKLREKIKMMETKYGWEFIFLAANQDAIASGSTFGIDSKNAMTFGADAGGMECALFSVAQNFHTKRAFNGSMAFCGQQREASSNSCVQMMPNRATR